MMGDFSCVKIEEITGIGPQASFSVHSGFAHNHLITGSADALHLSQSGGSEEGNREKVNISSLLLGQDTKIYMEGGYLIDKSGISG